MLVDGNSLTYRAFFALPTDLATASGPGHQRGLRLHVDADQPACATTSPTSVVVAFDRPEPTFRHEAGRHLQGQPRPRRPTSCASRWASSARWSRRSRMPDRRAGRLRGRRHHRHAGHRGPRRRATTSSSSPATATATSSSRTRTSRSSTTSAGVSDYALYDEAGILERTGVHARPATSQYAALRGDPSDNLPGRARAWGRRRRPSSSTPTAASTASSSTSTSRRRSCGRTWPSTRPRCARTPSSWCSSATSTSTSHLDDLVRGAVDPDEVRELFDFLEFRTLVERLAEAFGDAIGRRRPPSGRRARGRGHRARSTRPTAVGAARRAGRADDGRWPWPRPGTGADGPVAARSAWRWCATPATAEVAFVPGRRCSTTRPSSGALAALVGARRPTAGRARRQGADAGAARARRRRSHASQLDTELAAYLLDPAETRYVLDELLARYAGRRAARRRRGRRRASSTSAAPACRRRARRRPPGAGRRPPRRAAARRARRAAACATLHDDDRGAARRVLARMEHVGVGVDVDELRRLNDADGRPSATQLTAADLGGRRRGVQRQLARPSCAQILFDKLGLTPQKKTKTGFSTDAASLEKLAGQHPIIDHLLRYREVEKLRSTYGEGLLAEVGRRRSHPRHVQPDRGPHRPAQLRRARTCTTSRCAPRSGRGFRQAFVPAAGLPSSWSPTTTRSSCAASPTWPRTPG